MLFPQCSNEAERLSALHNLGILDTPSSPAMDRICGIAQRVFKVPMVFVTLIDAHRQWVKASYSGGAGTSHLREHAFCTYTILYDELFVIPDARAERAFAKNRCVVGEPFIRFYAGAPLIIRPGIRVGSLCVVDQKPREFDSNQIALLRSLSRVVVDELWLHHLEATGQAATQDFPIHTLEQFHDFETRVAPTGAQIRAARGLLNWSARELADAANISPTSIKRIEVMGETSVRRDSLDAVQKAFGERGVKFTRARWFGWSGTESLYEYRSGLAEAESSS
jgi:GAF domain-containing protein